MIARSTEPFVHARARLILPEQVAFVRRWVDCSLGELVSHTVEPLLAHTAPRSATEGILGLQESVPLDRSEHQRYSAGTMPSATATATSWCASVMPSCADMTIR